MKQYLAINISPGCASRAAPLLPTLPTANRRRGLTDIFKLLFYIFIKMIKSSNYHNFHVIILSGETRPAYRRPHQHLPRWAQGGQGWKCQLGENDFLPVLQLIVFLSAGWELKARAHACPWLLRPALWVLQKRPRRTENCTECSRTSSSAQQV